MKQINKGLEPNEFIRWKIANQSSINNLINNGRSGDDIWRAFPSSLSRDIVENDYCKSQLREALSIEQYYICCYCNDEVQGDSLKTKIEHFLPKEIYKEKTLDYRNLMVACSGGERSDKKPRILYCDSYKGNKDPSNLLIVSPFDDDISSHLSFKENGEIVGNTNKGENTITFLNLNCRNLILLRKEAIDTYISFESEETDTLIQEILTPIEGKLQKFCTAIVNVLENYK